MTDVGITKLIPQYEDPNYITQADVAYWEAMYTDGTVDRETDGTKYGQIDRSRLHSFRIIHHGEIMLEVFPPAGATGHNLIYRRRTQLGMMGVGRSVWFLVGYAPMGPYHVLSLDKMQMFTTDALTVGGIFDAPQPLPGEPEDML